MFKYNVSINGKYAGTAAGTTESAALLEARTKFDASACDRLTVTRVELGRKNHSDAAAGVAF